jgi:hypothetical protein
MHKNRKFIRQLSSFIKSCNRSVTSNDIKTFSDFIYSLDTVSPIANIQELLKSINEALLFFEPNKLNKYFFFEELVKILSISQSKYYINAIQSIAFTFENKASNDISLEEFQEVLLEVGKKYVSLEGKDSDFKNFVDEILKSNLLNISNKVTFKHRLIQEFLAAKQIVENPKLFEYLIYEGKYLKTSWHNVLGFLVASNSSRVFISKLIKLFELSNSNLDENLFEVLLSSVPSDMSEKDKEQLFSIIKEIFEKRNVWYPYGVYKFIWKIVPKSSLLNLLKSISILPETDFSAVNIGNDVMVLNGILKNSPHLFTPEQIVTLKSSLTELLQAKKGYGVLQRYALDALEFFIGDDELIKHMSTIFESKDKLVRDAVIDTVSVVSPNNEVSIKIALSGLKSGNSINSRYAFYRITNKQGIKTLLKSFTEDMDSFAKFLDDESIFNDKKRLGDKVLYRLLKKYYSAELHGYVSELLFRAYGYELKIYSDLTKSKFLTLMCELAKAWQADFVIEYVKRIIDAPEGSNRSLFYYSSAIVHLLSLETLDDFWNLGNDSEKVKNEIIKILNYIDIDYPGVGLKIHKTAIKKGYIHRRKKYYPRGQSNSERVYKEFLKRLKPTSGKFSPSVFDYYNTNNQIIDKLASKKDLNRLKTLILETVFKVWDVTKAEVKFTKNDNTGSSYSITSYIPIFEEAIVSASKLKLKEAVNVYRQNVINFIPFSYYEGIVALIDICGTIYDNDLLFVNSVYTSGSELKYFSPDSYCQIIENSLVQGVNLWSTIPGLKSIVSDKFQKEYIRSRALTILGKFPLKLTELNLDYFEEVFEYSDLESLKVVSNSILIKVFKSEKAIDWRIQKIVESIRPFEKKEVFHRITNFEKELLDSEFASPLFEAADYISPEKIIQLLDYSVELGRNQLPKFRSGLSYIWNIVEQYYINIQDNTFSKFKLLDDWYELHSSDKGLNWFSSKYLAIRAKIVNDLSTRVIDPVITLEPHKNG